MYQRIPLLLDLSRKKFVLSMIIRIFAAREPAKASQRCSNVRVVFVFMGILQQELRS